MRLRSPLPALAATMVLLGGCVSFGPKVPASLLTLSSGVEVPVGAGQVAADGRVVQVGVPSVPAELMPLRIPVHTNANEIAYIKDATWADAPARLFRNIVADTISVRTGRVVLDPRGPALTPGIRVGGRLEAFGVDLPTHMAVVTFDGTLARTGSNTVDTRRFEARVPLTTEDGPAVAAMLSQATNQVAAQVADWVGR